MPYLLCIQIYDVRKFYIQRIRRVQKVRQNMNLIKITYAPGDALIYTQPMFPYATICHGPFNTPLITDRLSI